MTFFPSPSILNASFETICFSFSLAVKLQSYPFVHLLTASSLFVDVLISLYVLAPHRQVSGKTNLLELYLRLK